MSPFPKNRELWGLLLVGVLALAGWSALLLAPWGCASPGVERSGPRTAAKVSRVPQGFEQSEQGTGEDGWAKQIIHKVSGIEFVLIPSGEFVMGSPPSEPVRLSFEDQHRVKIPRPFYLGKYEVTRGQFAAFIRETGYKCDYSKGRYEPLSDEFPSTPDSSWKEGEGWVTNPGHQWKGGSDVFLPGHHGVVIFDEDASWENPGFEQTDDHPVVCVNRDDALAFCRRVGGRLPTEAEWEYACRAGTTTAFPWGEDPAGGEGWCNIQDQMAMKIFPEWKDAATWSDGYVYTAPVGSFKPNAWGLYDMVGNVTEWCSDEVGSVAGAKSDPQGTVKKYFVIRGGAWCNPPDACRSAFSWSMDGVERINTNGFRVAVDAR